MEEYLKRRKEAEKEARIDEILKAARKLFLTKGYAGTTVREIAREAQVSTGVLYFYTAGKEEIYAIICRQAYQHLLDMAFEASLPETDPLLNLQAAVLAVFRFFREFPDEFSVLNINSGQYAFRLDDGYAKKIDESRAMLVSMLHEKVTNLLSKKLPALRERTVKDAVFIIWTSIFGMITFHQKAPGLFESDIESIVKRGFQYIKGIMH